MNSPASPNRDALVGFVDFDLMIERLALEYPRVSRARIERIARTEYDAVVGDRIFVAPAVVEEGSRERLDDAVLDLPDIGTATG